MRNSKGAQTMKIKRGRFTIRTDKWNIWVEEKVETEGGKTTTVNHGYYRDLDKCMKDFVKRKTLGSDEASVKKALERLSDALKDAESIIDGYIEGKAAEYEERSTEKSTGKIR